MDKLYRKLEDYGKTDFYPFHMPGHKRNKLSVDSDFPFERDITEISGFDNLHHPEGIIKEAQEALAELYGTKESFFSVNGSTAALLAAISASVKKGGQILAARNCHKAVYHGIYLRELVPTYIYPQADPELGISGEIPPSRVERCLEENPEIEAVIITSPTYDGVVSDVRKIAEIAHEHNAILIVDEAHGAHFMFSEYFPQSAVEMGADLVVQSFHKTLPALTQTAVLHRVTDRADSGKIKKFLGIYQTSSPSYILMASLDACVDKMARDGEKMFREFTHRLECARQRLEKCEYICLKSPAGYDFDRSKLILASNRSTLNGPGLAEILRSRFHIETEMETERYIIAMTAVGDTEEGFIRLCNAIEEIDREESLKIKENNMCRREHTEEIARCGKAKQIMTISEAMEAGTRRCPLEESIGRTSAEFAYIYPPGIPLLVPGEQITGLFVRNVRRYMEQGLNLQGLSDDTNDTICIVKE